MKSASQLMPLIIEARDLVAERKYAAAVGRLGTVLESDPGNAEAAAVLGSIRTALESARGLEVERLLAAAKSRLETGAGEATETIAARIFRLEPDNQEALELLEHTYGTGEAPGADWQPQLPEQEDIELFEVHVQLMERVDRLLARASRLPGSSIESPSMLETSAPATSPAAVELEDRRQSQATPRAAGELAVAPEDPSSRATAEAPEPRPLRDPVAAASETPRPSDPLDDDGPEPAAFEAAGHGSSDPSPEEIESGPVTTGATPEEVESRPVTTGAAVGAPAVRPVWWAIGLAAVLATAVILVLMIRAARPSESEEGGRMPPEPGARTDGQVSVNAVPWAIVVIEGEKRGATPLRLSLAPGSYDVVLEHPDYGRASYPVQIESGGLENVTHRYPPGAREP